MDMDSLDSHAEGVDAEGKRARLLGRHVCGAGLDGGSRNPNG